MALLIIIFFCLKQNLLNKTQVSLPEEPLFSLAFNNMI